MRTLGKTSYGVCVFSIVRLAQDLQAEVLVWRLAYKAFLKLYLW